MAIFRVKKVSPALFGFKKDALEAELKNTGEKQKYVGRIVGTCRDVGTVATQFGESVQLKGSFAAHDIYGNEHVSGTCYLPDSESEEISAVLRQTGGDVAFAFDFFVELNARGTMRYVTAPVGDYVDPLASFKASLPPMPRVEQLVLGMEPQPVDKRKSSKSSKGE